MNKSINIAILLALFAFNVHGMNPNAEILNAVKSNNTQKIKELIKNCTDLNVQDDFNNTLVHWAIYNHNTKIAKLLIKSGANVNIQSDEGATPLHHAVMMGFTKIVKLLLEFGADKNIKNNNNETAIDIANQHNHSDIKYLISKFDDQEFKNRKTLKGLIINFINKHRSKFTQDLRPILPEELLANIKELKN